MLLLLNNATTYTLSAFSTQTISQLVSVCCNFVQIIWCPVRFQATYSNVGEGNQIPGNQILHQCWYYYAIKQEYSLWCNFQDNQLVSNWKFVDVLHAFSDVNKKKRVFNNIKFPQHWRIFRKYSTVLPVICRDGDNNLIRHQREVSGTADLTPSTKPKP